MTAHVCSEECGHGHWKAFTRIPQPRRGRITLDVYDGAYDQDANAYKDYEPEERTWDND